DRLVEVRGEFLHDAAGGGDERLPAGGGAAKQMQAKTGVKMPCVLILTKVAALHKRHRDVVHGGDIEPELLGEGARADPLGGSHDGLKDAQAFVEGKDGRHDVYLI